MKNIYFFRWETKKIISPYDQNIQNNNYMLMLFSLKRNGPEVPTNNKTGCFEDLRI